ncbi:MAG: hypothetical protein J5808_05120, partial [Paludibacteraceae bacterium]|nr:hypothetical protein [Paludibacteraceae bacterium]
NCADGSAYSVRVGSRRFSERALSFLTQGSFFMPYPQTQTKLLCYATKIIRIFVFGISNI